MDEGLAMARFAYYGITTAEDEEEAKLAMCEKCGFSGCRHDEARRERLREDHLDAVIFDMMLENENPPDKDTLQKWIIQFPQYGRELKGFVKGWRIMERRQESKITPAGAEVRNE